MRSLKQVIIVRFHDPQIRTTPVTLATVRERNFSYFQSMFILQSVAFRLVSYNCYRANQNIYTHIPPQLNLTISKVHRSFLPPVPCLSPALLSTQPLQFHQAPAASLRPLSFPRIIRQARSPDNGRLLNAAAEWSSAQIFKKKSRQTALRHSSCSKKEEKTGAVVWSGLRASPRLASPPLQQQLLPWFYL